MSILLEINWDYLLGDGLIITFVGYLIVFLSLILLSSVFSMLPRLLNYQTRRELRRKGKEHELNANDLEISGEVNAAISTAIFLFLDEQHDQEDPVITIKRISKNYTPWSSKIYGVTRNLNRRF